MKKFLILFNVFLFCLLLNSCSNSNGCALVLDTRVHNVENQIKNNFSNDEYNIKKYSQNDFGFSISAVKAINKSLITGIQYVTTNEESVEVDYNLNYNKDENKLNICINEYTTNYNETAILEPIFGLNGEFDGTVILNNQKINLFDYTDEGIYEEDIENLTEEDCFILTSTICGIAVWKIALLASAAVVTYTVASNPIYVNSLANAIDESLNFNNNNYNVSKIVIGGITFALTKATAQAINVAKKQSDDEYYVAIPITQHNATEYPNSNIGDLLISNYPISKSQAVNNLKKGIDCYTYTATKAKKVMQSAFCLYSIKKDNVTQSGYYPHYHAWLFGSKKIVNGHTMHSFYGTAV